MQLIIDTSQTKVTVKDRCFYIQNSSTKRQISPSRIKSIAITSNVLINSSAIMLAAENEIPIHYFDNTGKVKARLWSPYFKNLASLRQRQILLADSPVITRFIIDALEMKFDLKMDNIRRYSSIDNSNESKCYEFITRIDNSKNKLSKYTSSTLLSCRESLLGIEGSVSRAYWSAIATTLSEPYRFDSRTRRPAKDIFNSALNYLYGMLYSVIENAVFASGLDPLHGYLHKENYKKPSLVFDLIEPFRPYIDKCLLELCHSTILKKEHFSRKGHGYWVSKNGKKILIPAFNEWMDKSQSKENKYKLRNKVYAYVNSLKSLLIEHDVSDHL